MAFAEYNGFEDKNDYEFSPKVTKRLASELAKPFVFEYANGHVGAIFGSPKVSTTVVNIIRGILSFFQVTVKTTQTVYELREVNHFKMNNSIPLVIGNGLIDVRNFDFVCRLESMASVRVTMLLKKMRRQRIGSSLRLWM